MVPSASILFMAVAGLFSIALPAGLFIYWRRKYEMKFFPVITGAAAFLIFAMGLEQVLHMFVLQPVPGTGTPMLLENSPALFVLYTVLAAGVFEETARFASFKYLKRKYQGVGTALSYGIGHGGIEAVILLGLGCLNSIIISLMINVEPPQALAEAGITAEMIESYTRSNPFMFLVGGIERIFAVTLHISASVLVWLAATRKEQIRLYPLAIGLHAAVNIPAILMQAGMITSLLLTETLIGIGAAAAAVIAVYFYKKQGES